MKENYFEKGDRALSTYEAYGRNPVIFNRVIENYKTYEAYGRNPVIFNRVIENYKKVLKLQPKNILYRYRLGYAYHLMRRLMEASIEYEKVLKLDPPRLATEAELKLVSKYAPRLFTNPKEFFKLKDLVAIINPKQPIIAYNLFWEDMKLFG